MRQDGVGASDMDAADFGVVRGSQFFGRSTRVGGLVAYPITANRPATAGAPTTAVVVQYEDGGLVDGHQIYRQLPAVRYQYGCFLASYLRDGVPTVFAPAAESAACP